MKASDIPTGLNNHEEVNVTLSPNPFDNTLQIVGDTQIASLKMTSINGVSLISTVITSYSIHYTKLYEKAFISVLSIPVARSAIWSD